MPRINTSAMDRKDFVSTFPPDEIEAAHAATRMPKADDLEWMAHMERLQRRIVRLAIAVTVAVVLWAVFS